MAGLEPVVHCDFDGAAGTLPQSPAPKTLPSVHCCIRESDDVHMIVVVVGRGLGVHRRAACMGRC